MDSQTYFSSDLSQEAVAFLRGSSVQAYELEPSMTLGVDEWPETWFSYNESVYPRRKLYRLPRPSAEEVSPSLDTSLGSRSSVREPGMGTEVSALAAALWGATHRSGASGPQYRPYPSAGARTSVEIYVWIARCSGSEFCNGLYSYNVREHGLYLVREGLRPSGIRPAVGESWIADSDGIIFLTACLDRTVVKYGDRGLRYSMIEVGALAQCLVLKLGSEKIRSCLVGGFADQYLHHVLRCTPGSEMPLLAIPFNSGPAETQRELEEDD